MRQWRDGRNETNQLPHSKEAEELMGEGETSEGMVLGKPDIQTTKRVINWP